MFKLILSLLSMAGGLFTLINKAIERRRNRKEFQSEQITSQMEKLRRAVAARRARRNTDLDNPDNRLQDDGHRRD
jgi:acetyl-CoA carboxylase alpha subunit